MKNALDLSYLVPLFPLIGFLVIGLGRKYLSKSLTGIIGSGVILVSFIISVWIFFQVKDGNSGVIEYFNFISAGTLKIPFAFQIDALSSLFLLIITGVGFLIHVYSASYMHHESKEHFARYFFLPESICFLHVATGYGWQFCNSLHRLGRCWFLFLFVNRILF